MDQYQTFKKLYQLYLKFIVRKNEETITWII